MEIWGRVMSGLEIAQAAATGAQVAGSVIKGVSAFQNSRLQAALTKREGDAALAQSQVEQDITLAEGERAAGEARAAAGAGGFDLSGSPTDILGRLAAERSAAARTSLYEGQTTRDAAYFEAKQIKKAGNMEALSAGLEAVTTAASGGMQAYEAGKGRRAAKQVAKEQGAWAAKTRARVPANLPSYTPLRLTGQILSRRKTGY
jgi:adenine-specific DNA methylase